MKTLPSVFVAFFLSCSFAVEVGDSAASVVRELGQPNARADLGGRELWQFPGGTVTVADGVVHASTLPRVSADVAAERREDGDVIAADMRKSLDFLLLPPERQLQVLAQFRVRFPAIDVSDLEQSAQAGIEARPRVVPAVSVPPAVSPAAQDVARLQREVRALEQAAIQEQERAAAETRVLQRLAEQSRQRDREQERERVHYAVPYPVVIPGSGVVPYHAPKCYTSPSFGYRTQSYKPSRGHSNFGVSGRAYGGVGSLVFGSGTRW